MAKKGNAPKKIRRGLEKRAQDETDDEWRRWFQEVDWRQKGLQRQQKRLIISEIVKEGAPEKVVREKSTPLQMKAILRKLSPEMKEVAAPKRELEDALEFIRTAWSNTVGEAIASETEVYSFKRGVLTISVASNTLLQELRQFYAESILEDLRGTWKPAVPLVKLTFITVKR